MKKILATGIISALAILPTFAAAQTATATNNSALIAVLEQLVQTLTQEITQLLAKQTVATTVNATTTNQSFTTPSGAVIGIDGTVLSAPIPSTASAPDTNSETAPSAITSAQTPTVSSVPTISITLGKQNITAAGSTPSSPTSLQMTWDTNTPTNSQIFLTPTGGATQVVSSESGLSTHHVVNVQNLEPSTQYSYMIEAIAGQQDQKISGSFTTPQQLIVSYAGIAFNANTTVDLETNFPINPQLSELIPTNSLQQSYNLAGTIQTAQENSNGTYSYYWTTNQSLQGVKGNFMVVLTTSDGQTVTSESFQEPNNYGGLIPGWCIQTPTLKASVCTQP